MLSAVDARQYKVVKREQKSLTRGVGCLLKLFLYSLRFIVWRLLSVSSQIWAALSDWELDAELNSNKTQRIQAAFEALNQDNLVYRGQQSERNLYHYTRFVAGNPTSLKAHVRRIYMATALGMREELSGALMDLLWVLDQNGPTLRRRIFEQVSAMLPPRSKRVISRAIEANDRKLLLELPIDRAVLVNGQFSPVI